MAWGVGGVGGTGGRAIGGGNVAVVGAAEALLIGIVFSGILCSL